MTKTHKRKWWISLASILGIATIIGASLGGIYGINSKPSTIKINTPPLL